MATTNEDYAIVFSEDELQDIFKEYQEAGLLPKQDEEEEVPNQDKVATTMLPQQPFHRGFHQPTSPEPTIEEAVTFRATATPPSSKTTYRRPSGCFLTDYEIMMVADGIADAMVSKIGDKIDSEDELESVTSVTEIIARVIGGIAVGEGPEDEDTEEEGDQKKIVSVESENEYRKEEQEISDAMVEELEEHLKSRLWSV